MLSEMAGARVLPVDHKFLTFAPSIGADKRNAAISTSIHEIKKGCEAINEKALIEKLRKKFKAALGSGFKYEFSQGDLDKVQELINQIRNEVSCCSDLDDGHKARLLKRFEALQSELHKKISDLDKFWGLIGDASIVLAKIGNNSKPIVDRVKEIADIGVDPI